jgi:putative endonuclease
MRPAKQFYVYIMTNRPRSHVLYTGVTGNLPRRVFEHKNKSVPGFTARYNLTRLVYYELFYFAGAAIEREKQIKGWSRNKKIALITSLNPRWDDLASGWGNQFKPDGVRSEGASSTREILRAWRPSG